jgi:hypothetical protein
MFHSVIWLVPLITVLQPCWDSAPTQSDLDVLRMCVIGVRSRLTLLSVSSKKLALLGIHPVSFEGLVIGNRYAAVIFI